MPARVDGSWWDAPRLGAAIPVPDLSIEGIVARLELTTADWGEVAAAGYFGNSSPWEG
jgi:S-adenosylmethionine synthetase